MAIAYPLDLPTTIGIESITLRAINAIGASESQFTFKQQVFVHPGQRWEASVTVPPLRRDVMAPWKAFLTALKGASGTFLLGDPDYATPQGDVSSCAVSGAAGEEDVTVTMTGTLKAGDYIQLGSGSAARLHMVLADRVGSGTMNIWPALRQTYSGQTAIIDSPRGLFRLASNMSEWSINNENAYGISFEAVEVVI